MKHFPFTASFSLCPIHFPSHTHLQSLGHSESRTIKSQTIVDELKLFFFYLQPSVRRALSILYDSNQHTDIICLSTL
jgi:hypothetical protein